MRSGEKRLDIEVMRIIACYFVIFNHTGNSGFFLFSTYSPRSFQFWLYQFFGIFCKFSVSLFFAIAGTLLLNREPETFRYIFRHRILKIVRILIIWSFIYYLILSVGGDESFSLLKFWEGLYGKGWNYSYWYLYAYIGFLIVLPILQRIAKNLEDKDYLFIFAVVLLFKDIIPILQYRFFNNGLTINASISLAWFKSDIFLYPLTGYFLNFRTRDFWNKKRIICLAAVDTAGILAGEYMTYYWAKVTGVCDQAHSQTFFTSFLLINCITVYVICMYLFSGKRKIPEAVQKVIRSMGECTLGIYLIHSILLRYARPVCKVLQARMNDMLGCLIYCSFIFITCYAAVWLLRKIPIARKILF